MIIIAIGCSSLAALLPTFCVPGVHLLRAHQLSRTASYHTQAVPNVPSPISVLLDPLDGHTHLEAAPHSCSTDNISKELLRWAPSRADQHQKKLHSLEIVHIWPDFLLGLPPRAVGCADRDGCAVSQRTTRFIATAPTSCITIMNVKHHYKHYHVPCESSHGSNHTCIISQAAWSTAAVRVQPTCILQVQHKLPCGSLWPPGRPRGQQALPHSSGHELRGTGPSWNRAWAQVRAWCRKA